MRTIILVMVFILLPLCVSFGAKLHVGQGYEYSTIQSAIDAAADTGDTVLVHQGIYYENINFIGKEIIVKNIENSPLSTIIHGSDSGHVVTFNDDEGSGSKLVGFTISNGYSNYGGGIYCGYGTSPEIKKNIIENNHAEYDGGGIYCYDGSFPKITESNEVINNYAYRNGGGIYCGEYASPTINQRNAINTNEALLGGGIYCAGYSSPVIRNNDIIHNVAGSGGGIYCAAYSSPIITKGTNTDGNIIIANLANEQGGGIYCDTCEEYSRPIIRYNQIKENEAYEGGGICCSNSSSPEITNNTIESNTATDGGYNGKGGGVFCFDSSSPEITGNTIELNEADIWGGGICCLDESSPEITDNTIKNNTKTVQSQTLSGGGIACCYESSPIIEKNTIESNMAYLGGGIYSLFSSSPVILKNIIETNIALLSGGGIHIRFCSELEITENTIRGNEAQGIEPYGNGGGICCNESSYPIIEKNIIESNNSKYGGGVACFSRPASFKNNTIKHNEAVYGGGIGCGQNTPIIENNIIWDNDAYQGGGIFCQGSYSYTYPKIINDTIVGNSADQGGGIYCSINTEVTISNTILWGNHTVNDPYEIFVIDETGQDPAIVEISYCDVEGGINTVFVGTGCTLNWGDGIIDADPIFVDSANGDFHLLANSPCSDSGDNSGYTEPCDFEGDPRDAWGGTVDMGADEFYTHLYYTGNATPGSQIVGKLIGIPGTQPIGLFIGAGILEEPWQHMWGEFWLVDWVAISLPSMPANGIHLMPTTIPLDPPAPYDLPMQGLVGETSESLTNLLLVEVK